MAKEINEIKGWSRLLADNNDESKIHNDNAIDYPAYIKALSDARLKYHDTHDMADYKAMSTVREQYGITRDAEKPLATILAMQENNIHKNGIVICHIPKKDFEEMLNGGQWAELELRIKQAANPNVINEAAGGRYPMLGELFKSNHKDARVAMTAFGLYKDIDGYSVKVDPKKLELTNYDYFSKAIESLKAEKQKAFNIESHISTNFETIMEQEKNTSRDQSRNLHM